METLMIWGCVKAAEPLLADNFLPLRAGTRLIDLGKMKDSFNLGATQWLNQGSLDWKSSALTSGHCSRELTILISENHF